MKLVWQMDQGDFSSYAGAIQVRCGEKWVEPEGKPLNSPVNLRSNSHQRNKIMNTSGQNGLSLRDSVRSSDIQRSLGVQPLPLRIERSQTRWFGHLVRMPLRRLPGEMLQACPSGGRAWGSLSDTFDRLYLSADLGTPRIPQQELVEVPGNKGHWSLLMALLPPQPSTGSGMWKVDGWMTH